MSHYPVPYEIGTIYRGKGNYARSRSQRRRGLARIEIDKCPEELIFENCRSIHTFGMKFDLVVLFLDKNKRILKSKIVGKNRIVFGPRGTYSIVELPFR